jgi:pimeloyl-ACP methyl ester carboxylesterase
MGAFSSADAGTDLMTASGSSGNLGLSSESGMRTCSNGSRLAVYRPPFLNGDAFKNGDVSLKITASCEKSVASINLKLIRIPVVLIHGYKASPEIFGSMEEFLQSKGYNILNFDYNTDNGVASGAKELMKYLDSQKTDLLEKGIKVSKFDIVSHSMGGLVARYYTCNNSYTSRNDVDKLIFLSVPHAGSPLASLGLNYYEDQGIYDLMPDGSLFTSEFPAMINKGLNSSIQVGNILGQYDEAVSPESASLDEWGIDTEMFSVGDNNFTLDKLLSGQIADAANHKLVLYNKKVFQRVEQMLGTTLPYPQKR